MGDVVDLVSTRIGKMTHELRGRIAKMRGTQAALSHVGRKPARNEALDPLLLSLQQSRQELLDGIALGRRDNHFSVNGAWAAAQSFAATADELMDLLIWFGAEAADPLDNIKTG
jgi:hypothetical protein